MTKPRRQPAIRRHAPPCDEPRLHFGHYFLLALLFVLLAACYQIVHPYLHTIVLAGILATVFMPVNRRLGDRLGNRPTLAALFSCLLLTLLVLLPLLFTLIGLVQQGIGSFHAISGWIADGGVERTLASPLARKGVDLLHRSLPEGVAVDPAKIRDLLLDSSSTMGRALIEHGGGLVGDVTALFGKFFLMLFVFFFLVRDGSRLVGSLHHLIPLSTSHEKQILEKMRSVARSALLGTLITALAQGVAGGIAFAICGFPALFWGVVMAFTSLVPAVGTALVWGPAAAYLFLSGHWGLGAFLVAWSVLVVGSIDNFVRPMFMKGDGEMSTVLIFFAILGGINSFGLIGILYGPLLLGLTLITLYLYRIEFGDFLRRQDHS